MAIESLAMKKSLNDPKYDAFAKYLKNARVERGFTVREVAVLLDEDHQVISKMENGERKVSVQEYVQYCEVLKLDLLDGLELLKQ